MKFKQVRILLWTVRVLLALLVLYWAAMLMNIALAYAQYGSEGIRGYLMHVGTPAKDYLPSRDEELRDTQLAYEVLIVFILLTWLLRELENYLRKRLGVGRHQTAE